ncbi:MAG: macro domain-containing protein [Deltaproteobacteria bacterium]|jgi:O-acetyl-ADP-ribose deacetylase (regulator of RNase III)|nr:macro domain-containing protein [Deltaproteobacteria bacterium]
MPLYVIYEDITKLKVDAIVNAANENLSPGGGVCGAIFQGAGSLLLKDCQAYGHCDTGKAAITFAYKLKPTYVIHAVGPIWQGGGKGEEALLRSAYQEAMTLASTHDCNSVAFPLISAGIYGYPQNEAFHVAVDSIGAYLQTDREINVFLSNFEKKDLGLNPAEKDALKAYIDGSSFIGPAGPKASLDESRKALLKIIDGLYGSDLEKAAKKANLRLKDLKNILFEGSEDAEEDPAQREKSLAKGNVVQLLLSLEADPPTFLTHLEAFGHALDYADLKDKIVSYFVQKGLFDVFHLNEAVHAFTRGFLTETDPALLVKTPPPKRVK